MYPARNKVTVGGLNPQQRPSDAVIRRLRCFYTYYGNGWRSVIPKIVFEESVPSESCKVKRTSGVTSHYESRQAFKCRFCHVWRSIFCVYRLRKQHRLSWGISQAKATYAHTYNSFGAILMTYQKFPLAASDESPVNARKRHTRWRKTRRERVALPVKFENVHQEASTKKVSGFSPQMSERGGSTILQWIRWGEPWTNTKEEMLFDTIWHLQLHLLFSFSRATLLGLDT